MRVVPIIAVVVLWSGAAIAQAPAPTAPPAGPPSAPQAEPPPLPPATIGVSRDDYISKARDAAEKRAATRFDEMDTNHDGVLTKDEIAVYRAAHARKKPSEPQ